MKKMIALLCAVFILASSVATASDDNDLYEIVFIHRQNAGVTSQGIAMFLEIVGKVRSLEACRNISQQYIKLLGRNQVEARYCKQLDPASGYVIAVFSGLEKS